MACDYVRYGGGLSNVWQQSTSIQLRYYCFKKEKKWKKENQSGLNHWTELVKVKYFGTILKRGANIVPFNPYSPLFFTFRPDPGVLLFLFFFWSDN